MSSQAIKKLGRFTKLTVLDRGPGVQLPEAYKKFYKEWKFAEPAAVHYIPEEGKLNRNEITGEVRPIQNYPIPIKYPPEHNEQLWGGEGVIQGFTKRNPEKRRVPHFWIPNLQRSVVYTEILNKHVSVVVTDRAIQLIHANYGFDHYILKTLACDLKSLLALVIKRQMLQELLKGCPTYADNPSKQEEIYNRYKKYLEAYTPEEIEWYGYSFDEACKKHDELLEAQETIVPLKHILRAKMFEKLKTEKSSLKDKEISGAGSWLQKINPFVKKQET